MASTAEKSKGKNRNRDADSDIEQEMMTREDIQRVKDLPEEFASLHRAISAREERMLDAINRLGTAQEHAASAQVTAAEKLEHAAEELEDEYEDDTWGRWFLRGVGRTVGYVLPHTRKEAFHVAEGVGIGAYVSQSTSMFDWMGGGGL